MLDFAKIFKNEYFVFKDFRENELVLYSKYNKLWVAKCYSVPEVSLDQRNNSECFQDIKITFKINNETLKGYLGENLIIKNNSVLVDCQSIDQLLVFENSYVKRFKKVTKKFEGKFLAHNTKLELNLFNLSKLNYFHSRTILEKIDFLNEFKKVLFKDDFHFKENSQDKLFYVNSSSIFTRVAKSLTSFSNFIGFYVKIIFYTIVLLVIVWVSFKLE